MNKKYILGIILVIIVGGLVFWMSKGSEPEPPVEPVIETETGIMDLLAEIKQETGVNFSEPESVEMKWVVEVEPRVQEITIGGKGFGADRISSEQYDSVESFLINNGFEKDLYNMTDATISGLMGYKKDRIVCTVAGGATGYREAEGQWISPEPDINDIEIKCGRLEQSIGEAQISLDEAFAIAGENRECANSGVLSDNYVYNSDTKTWWIDLERVPELENDGCNPACVVNEEIKTAEVNWRCMGVLPSLP